jgi:hypothetical protein
MLRKIWGDAMRKLVLMMLLAVVSSNAMAEWISIGEGERRVSYIDLNTISKSGNLVKVWVMFDLKEAKSAEGIKFLSSANQIEVDCKEELIHMLAMTAYSKNMAQGIALKSIYDVHDEWHPVPPNSGESNIWKIACGRLRLRK